MKKIKKIEIIETQGYPFEPDFDDIKDGNAKLTIIRLVVKINDLIKTVNLLSEAKKK